MRLRQEVRRRRLEMGESGWGAPAPQPARLSGLSASKSARVAVIGAGRQGLAQCQGLRAVKGIDIVGLADVQPAILQKAADTLRLPTHARFTDAATMLKEAAPLDLVCVATTAPSHVKLGRLALETGVRRILLEKPMDNSLREARAFQRECRAADAVLAINHSRRWMLDYRAITRCIGKNFIGEPRSISVAIGKGELAMHGSHYFDLCRFLLKSEPAWLSSSLEPVTSANVRGADFHDPSGFCLIVFESGARAYIDFSSDLVTKAPFLTIKGTLGQITVDEQSGFWTLQSRSQRVWNFPFAESLKAAPLFSRVAAEVLSGGAPASSGADGVAALEMILAAHLSNERGHRPVRFPLSDEESSLKVKFP
ncbi:MAG: Gfo/Idh/MocA family protein [Pyrinomonadaceae bacterium]